MSETKTFVQRPAGGISLNENRETLADDNGHYITFDSEEHARAWLADHGFTSEDIESFEFAEYTVIAEDVPADKAFIRSEEETV